MPRYPKLIICQAELEHRGEDEENNRGITTSSTLCVSSGLSKWDPRAEEGIPHAFRKYAPADFKCFLVHQLSVEEAKGQEKQGKAELPVLICGLLGGSLALSTHPTLTRLMLKHEELLKELKTLTWLAQGR